MFASLGTVFNRNADTLVEDAAGCLALVVFLYVGLVLPTLI
jgi:hypothetical protein